MEDDFPPSELPNTNQLINWQVHLEPRGSDFVVIDLVFKDEVLLGLDDESPASTTLNALSAKQFGVSRRHARLKVQRSTLYAVDLESTNRTKVNGRPLKPYTPHPITDEDVLSLGELDLIVRIKQGVKSGSGALNMPKDFPGVLAQIAKSMTGQLAFDDVMHTLLNNAIRLVQAHEASVWLLNRHSDELLLEAQIGIEDETIKRARIPATNPLVSAAFMTGQPVRGSRKTEGEAIKIKTGYLVEAVLYVPLVHKGKKLGVLAATKRTYGDQFTRRDEVVLETLSDFAAIAITNARLYEEAQRANQLKLEMIQNISHEFRTPLAFILGYVSLLAHDDSIAADTRQQMRMVEVQANRLKWLLDNFTSFRLDDGHAYERTATDIPPLVENAVAAIRGKVTRRHQQIYTHIADDVPPVHVDEAEMTRVLENLLSNASKFSPDDTRIAVDVLYDPRIEQVIVSITDEGVGIAPSYHERIFEPFYQVDGSMTRSYSGVGLGLTVSKHIIEGHGGTIWVESTPDEGSTFAFTLAPIREEDTSHGS